MIMVKTKLNMSKNDNALNFYTCFLIGFNIQFLNATDF